MKCSGDSIEFDQRTSGGFSFQELNTSEVNLHKVTHKLVKEGAHMNSTHVHLSVE